MENILIGAFISALVSWLLYIANRDHCIHEWRHENTSNYKNRSTNIIEYHVKHYQCTKCLKTKDVRIG